MNPTPPVPKYKLTLAITGNTLDEIEGVLLSQINGGFLLNSDYYRRDEWDVTDGRYTSRMEHTNPDMTPERYNAELNAWFDARKARRREQSTRKVRP